MVKFFAKEFLWLLLSLVLALPLAFLWLSGLDIVSTDSDFNQSEKIFVIELFLLAYVFSFVGIYLIRMVVGAIKILAGKEEAAEE